jgi:hypothetical protein
MVIPNHYSNHKSKTRFFKNIYLRFLKKSNDGTSKIGNRVGKSGSIFNPFFILFALLFLIASVGFWQLGKTDLARAYIIPTLVAGLLLMIIGVGLVYTNTNRVTEFETAYHQDATAFIASEFDRI